MAEILAKLEDKIGHDEDKERRKQIKTLQTFLRFGHSKKNICHFMRLSESEFESLLTDIDEELLKEAFVGK